MEPEFVWELTTPIKNCPLCGKDEIVQSFTVFKFEFVVCECGMIYMEKYMTQEQINNYYKSEYRKYCYPYTDEVTDHDLLGETKKGERYRVFTNCVSPKKHLDIGSSTGTFLKLMNESHGCDSIGVEPLDKFREYSNKQGIYTVADLSEVEGKYDFISLGHVLEHLLDPLELLGDIHNLLEDDGHLFVEVPRSSAVYSHPLMFIEKTLENMLIKAEYKVEELIYYEHIMAMATH